MKKIITLCLLAFVSIIHLSAQAPTINSFSPSSGAVGTSVTIPGTNFSTTASNNVVYFGATKATVTAATATSLTVAVPTGATYGAITVLNTSIGLSAASNSYFNPTFTPNKSTFTTSDFNSQPLAKFYWKQAQAIKAGDMDGDGKIDIVEAAQSGGLMILRNTSSCGTTNFDYSEFATEYGTADVQLADINGDGKLDMLAGNGNGYAISYLINKSTPGSLSFNNYVYIGSSAGRICAVGDLNRDGRPDIVVSNYNTIEVWRNTSTSTTNVSFALDYTFPTSVGAVYDVKIADIDGDGKLDIVEGDINSNNNVYVFLNQHTSGAFSASSFATTTISNGTNSQGSTTNLKLADFDGDGKLDIATLSNQTGHIHILRNISTTGTPSFQTFQTLAKPGGSQSNFDIGDLTGDGKVDIVLFNYGLSTISVWVNNSTSGAISFQNNVDFNPSANQQWWRGALADFDGDGKLDLVARDANQGSNAYIFKYAPVVSNNANLSSLTISPGLVKESFSPVSTSYTAVVNAATTTIIASKTDVFNKIELSFNGGAYSTITCGAATSALSLNVGNNTANIKVTAEDGTTTKTYTVTIIRPIAPIITSFSPLSAKPGDVVIITGSNFSTTASDNVLFFGTTKAIATASTATSLTVTVPVGATYSSITLFNGLTGLAANSSVKFNPTYTPSKAALTISDFATKVDVASGTNTNPRGVAMGDLDGDGKNDLVVANFNVNTISIFRNTSSTCSISSSSFATKVDFATTQAPISVAIADIDGDGKLDLVVANFYGGISVYRNVSTTGAIDASSFAAKVDFTIDNNPSGVAVADIDGDGQLDIVATTYQNTINILRNISNQGTIDANSFAAKVSINGGNRPVGLAVGDLDGDNKPDLAIVNLNENALYVYRNNSTTGSITSSSFSTPASFATNGSPTSITIGDLDGDGKADLAVSHSNGNLVSTYRNTSTTGTLTTSSFAAKVDFAAGYFANSVVIADVNGDGKLDIVNPGNGLVSILRNTATSGSINSGSFAANVDIPTAAGPYALAIGDLDGDGMPDIATANSSSNNISILKARSSSTINLTICPLALPYTWNGLTFTAAGSKTKTGFINSKGCDSVVTLNLSVGANAVLLTPAVSIATASETVCSGDNVSFTATPTNGGSSPTFQWKRNGVNVGSGSSISFLPNSLIIGDVISCVLTANNYCQTSATVNSNAITLTVKPSPAITPIADGISNITTATLCSLNSTYHYFNTTSYGVWASSNPSVASVSGYSQVGNVTANSNGNATITYNVTSANGCVSSASLAVTVAQQATPNAITGNNIVCAGSTTALSCTTPSGVWSSSNDRGTINAGGVYTGNNAGNWGEARYTVTNAAGCSAYASSTMIINAIPNVPTITYAPGTVGNPQAGAPTGSFCVGKTFGIVGSPSVPAGVWSSTGATSITNGGIVTINAAGAGSIKYTYTDVNGCSNSRTMSGNGYTCASRGVNIVEGQTSTVDGFTMYPNPAKGSINLNVETLIGKGSIIVTDLYGKVVKTQSLSMGSNTIDITNLTKGFYLVSVMTSEGKTTKKLIVE